MNLKYFITSKLNKFLTFNRSVYSSYFLQNFYECYSPVQNAFFVAFGAENGLQSALRTLFYLFRRNMAQRLNYWLLQNFKYRLMLWLSKERNCCLFICATFRLSLIGSICCPFKKLTSKKGRNF